MNESHSFCFQKSQIVSYKRGSEIVRERERMGDNHWKLPSNNCSSLVLTQYKKKIFKLFVVGVVLSHCIIMNFMMNR